MIEKQTRLTSAHSPWASRRGLRGFYLQLLEGRRRPHLDPIASCAFTSTGAGTGSQIFHVLKRYRGIIFQHSASGTLLPVECVMLLRFLFALHITLCAAFTISPITPMLSLSTLPLLSARTDIPIMGRGDMRTKKGKRTRKSFGVSRPRNSELRKRKAIAATSSD